MAQTWWLYEPRTRGCIRYAGPDGGLGREQYPHSWPTSDEPANWRQATDHEVERLTAMVGCGEAKVYSYHPSSGYFARYILVALPDNERHAEMGGRSAR